jgi:hypothetical protein
MHRFSPGLTVRSDSRGNGEKKSRELSCKRQLHGGFDHTSREISGLHHRSLPHQHFQLLPWRFRRLTHNVPEHLFRVKAHLVK